MTFLHDTRTILWDVMAQLESDVPEGLPPSTQEFIDQAYRALDEAYSDLDKYIVLAEDLANRTSAA